MEDELGRGTKRVKVEKTSGQLPLSYLPLLRPKVETVVRSSYDRVPSPAPSKSSWLKDTLSSSKSSHSRESKFKASTIKNYGPISKPSTLRDTASPKPASRELTSSKPSTSRDSFLSRPSTSKDFTSSKSKDLLSKASTSNISPTIRVSSPPSVLAPEEIDWDLERDAKYLSDDQKRAILETVEKDVKENPESFVADPRKLDVLAEYLRVSIGHKLAWTIKNSTQEEKKIMYKNLYTDHSQRLFLSEFKKHSVI